MTQVFLLLPLLQVRSLRMLKVHRSILLTSRLLIDVHEIWYKTFSLYLHMCIFLLQMLRTKSRLLHASMFCFFTDLYIAIPCRRCLQAKMLRTTLALQVPSRVHWTVWQFDIGFTWCFPLLLTRWAAQAVRMHPTCHFIDGIHDSGVPAAAIPAREIHADVAGASILLTSRPCAYVHEIWSKRFAFYLHVYTCS